jgi:hypothetical protein
MIDAPRSLSADERQALVADGFVLLPGIVPSSLVEAALRSINESLGANGIDPAALPKYRASSYAPDRVTSPEIVALYDQSPLRALVASTIGPVRPPTRGQIALRFPSADSVDSVPHIDGVAYPGNGVPPGTLAHFTALLGVFLSDAPQPRCGNFNVWPGSHRVVNDRLRAEGPAGFVGGFPPLPLGPPRPLCVRAGDAVLAHYQLAHGVAAHRGPHVRYAVFFRLTHVDHDAFGLAALHDLWRVWDGVRPFAGNG